jgi:hypothetical protein
MKKMTIVWMRTMMNPRLCRMQAAARLRDKQ